MVANHHAHLHAGDKRSQSHVDIPADLSTSKSYSHVQVPKVVSDEHGTRHIPQGKVVKIADSDKSFSHVKIPQEVKDKANANAHSGKSFSHVEIPQDKVDANAHSGKSFSHVEIPQDKVDANAHSGKSFSHVEIPQDKVDANAHSGKSFSHVEIPQDKVDANAHNGKSFSHVEVPQDKVDANAHNGKSFSHVEIPQDKVDANAHSGKSFSHVEIPQDKVDANAHNGKSFSHVEIPDNKKNFIQNHPADRVNKDTVNDDVSGTHTQKHSSTDTALSAEESYAKAKAMADRLNNGDFTTSSTAEATAAANLDDVDKTTRIVHTPLQTTRSSSAGSAAVTSSAAATSVARMVGAGVSTSRDPTIVAGVPLSATRSASADVTQSQKASGMSGGAKAGLAIGIILAIALVGGLVFFCFRRRKNHKGDGKEEVLDEKHGSFFGSNQEAPSEFRKSTQSDKASLRSTRTASTAPRLSLRPVTQFLPNIGDGGKTNNNGSLDPNAAMSEKSKSMWERQQKNPFDDDAVTNEKTARPESTESNPFEEGDGSKDASSASSGASSPDGPKSAVAVNAAGVPQDPASPSANGPNNVHRVQLDFKPSMEDELELKSGQLVRMLHEYDDGWALCMRMDRSQQGVCPRTCLSKLAVKPRPQGPPPNGPNGRPVPPPGSRGPSPPNAGSMVPRPLTPNGQNRERSQTVGRTSPVPQDAARSRSQSVADVTSADNVPARKPVPGQAL